ncbi:hypothetical protein AB6F64_08105 [Providencia hangzhouensis]|uniref:hypothetical protein n=1 Tax=Providencia TaxID=586 RepID=UPI0010BF31F0|nr:MULTISPECIES: hypothetical protein [Providencia]QIF66718.1 hypothetical protein FVA72_14925 [Providencia sp. 1709051003]
MEFKHSPAPWMATKREFFIELYDDNGSYVGLTNSTANAHLIAAAPELLEALIELTESAKEAIDGLGDLSDAIDTAKAAIAKALGQQ